jgi:hypothetical protein
MTAEGTVGHRLRKRVGAPTCFFIMLKFNLAKVSLPEQMKIEEVGELRVVLKEPYVVRNEAVFHLEREHPLVIKNTKSA